MFQLSIDVGKKTLDLCLFREPEPWIPRPLRRRDTLVTDSSREKNKLEKCLATNVPLVVAKSIENVLRNLSAELEHLEALILTHLDQHPELKGIMIF
ncbi:MULTISPECIES: hypothetical protein [Serratia]|uniref:hypothetical protein n=1 Tax=Serratia TaxID=613 RepID=UPI00384F8029